MMKEKMHILIIAVCHESYPELNGYMHSIDIASQNAKDVQVDILIADNSAKQETINEHDYPNCRIIYKHVDNLGYFGSARAALHGITTDDYTHMVISNVDLLMDSSFFSILHSLSINNDISCIAPSLYSFCEHQERNPEYAQRPSRGHLQLTRILYIHPLILRLYIRLIYRRRVPKQTPTTRQTIFAPHGSFILFVGNKTLPQILQQFQPFLYCEEIYVGNFIRQKGKHIIFEPQLKIRDLDHVTTSRMSEKFLCKCHREAIKWLLKHY